MDGLTYLSIYNLLGMYFNPGPGVLDANGEATAQIDVSSLGSLGVNIQSSGSRLPPSFSV
jgi:hypothetical protein